MKKRDELAVQMMAVLLKTADHWPESLHRHPWYWDDMETLGVVAYRLADAMILASRRKNEDTEDGR